MSAFSSELRECSGSVVECLTPDREAAGLSLIGVTALWSLSKTHLSKLSTGSTQEDPSLLLMGHKESNQTNNSSELASTFFDLISLRVWDWYLICNMYQTHKCAW